MEEEESLYLLETVEIELPGPVEEAGSTCTQSSDEEVSAISLIADPTARDRYFVRHNTGIHSVFLPAVQRLEHFVKGGFVSVMEFWWYPTNPTSTTLPQSVKRMHWLGNGI